MAESPTFWHPSGEIETPDGGRAFRKSFVPGSFEFRNELLWLSRMSYLPTGSFRVPKIRSHSEAEGTIDMEFVDSETISPEKAEEIMFGILSEIRHHFKSPKPYVKQWGKAGIEAFDGEYGDYVADYASWKLKACSDLNPEYFEDIGQHLYELISKVKVSTFSLVHRDMRLRHLMHGKNGSGTFLIDWEFSNISDHCQDVAKAICDASIAYSQPFWITFRKFCSECFRDNPDERLSLEHRTLTYSIVVILEHMASMVNRRKSAEIDKKESFDNGIQGGLRLLGEIHEQL